MQVHSVTSNQDGGVGEFSRQGACVIPVNTAAVAAKDHASTLGHVLAGCMTDAHRRCAVGCGQDYTQPEDCQTSHLKEGVAR